jgi:hypothetical protein
MLYFIVVGISGAILASALIIFRKVFFNMLEASLGLANEVLSDQDDLIKQSKLIIAVKKMLFSLGKVFITILSIAILTGLPIFLFSLFTKIDYDALDLRSGWFFLSLSIGSIFPFLFKKKVKVENYTESSILLHKLILNNYNLGKLLFSFDKRFKSGKTIKNKELFLIISGLARAGTTSLTDQLFKAGGFSSLDYSNMPFLLAPNLWKKLYNPKKVKLKERKHGDKMLFGFNTIEALEEYFFKVFFDDNYIEENILKKHEFNQEIYENYIKYQSLIRTDNSHIYLSKNNNLILRYSSLRSFNNTFKVVFLFRKPEEHAFSLLNQHLRFSELQKKDKFVETYMNWLGHHEFGSDHKIFSFDNQTNTIDYDKNTLNYWLAVWLNYYTYLANLNDSNYLLIEYKDYLKQPIKVIQYLENEMSMNFDLSAIKPFENNRIIDISDCDIELLNETNIVYQQLIKNKVLFD